MCCKVRLVWWVLNRVAVAELRCHGRRFADSAQPPLSRPQKQKLTEHSIVAHLGARAAVGRCQMAALQRCDAPGYRYDALPKYGVDGYGESHATGVRVLWLEGGE